MHPQPAESGRLHGLDALRAAAMLLGVVLHAALFYLTIEVGDGLPRDRAQHPAFNLLVFTIHLFRMPVFFLMAGYFCALLVDKRGWRAMAANRVRRVLAPLLLFWPVVLGGLWAAYAWTFHTLQQPFRQIPFGRLGDPFSERMLFHLWFLYHLLLFYAAAMLLRKAPGGPAIAGWALPRLAWMLRSFWGFFLLTALTAIPLLESQVGIVETSGSLTPPVWILAVYWLCFACGWAIFREGGVLAGWRTRWAAYASVFALLPLHLNVLLTPGRGGEWRSLILAVLGAAMLWGATIAVTGAFLRYVDARRAWARALSDASYWIYLVHLPLVAAAANVMRPFALPAALKFLTVTGSVFVITFLTYDLFVRNTFLGVLLNGRRYPRLIAWK